MKLLFALFVLAVSAIAASAVGFAVWDSGIGHHDVRSIHYDTNYDLSSQRRIKPQ